MVGMISGTSADSIDVAICRIAGSGRAASAIDPGPSVELLHYGEHPYEADVRRQILDVQRLNVAAIAELNVRVGDLFARACARRPLSRRGAVTLGHRPGRLSRADGLSP